MVRDIELVACRSKFSALYMRHEADAQRIAREIHAEYRIRGASWDDLLQEANMRAWSAFTARSGRGPDSYCAWFRSIAKRCAADMRRSESRGKRRPWFAARSELHEAKTVEQHTAREAFDRLEFDDLFEECLRRLPPRMSALLRRKCLQDVRASDLASEMGCSLSFVHRTIRDGMNRLEAILRQILGLSRNEARTAKDGTMRARSTDTRAGVL